MVETRRNRERLTLLLIIARSAAEFAEATEGDAGTKDAGHLFGAHGGALDRLDAVIFTIVAGYYVWLAVGH